MLPIEDVPRVIWNLNIRGTEAANGLLVFPEERDGLIYEVYIPWLFVQYVLEVHQALGESGGGVYYALNWIFRSSSAKQKVH